MQWQAVSKKKKCAVMLLSSVTHFYNLEKSGQYIIHDCGFVDFTKPVIFRGEVQPERKEVIHVRF